MCIRDRVGTQVQGQVVTPQDCDVVRRAFSAVGIESDDITGWTTVDPELFSIDPVAILSGLHLYRGCTINDQILWGSDSEGNIRTSNIADGLRINFDNNWGAFVTQRGAQTDPTDRSVNYTIWNLWFNYGVVDVIEKYNRPPDVEDSQCLYPRGKHPRILYSKERIASWATFFDGHKGDTIVNSGVRMPDGCTIETVLGQEYHHGEGPVNSPTSHLDHGDHGFRVIREVTDPRNLDVKIHWWHDGLSAVFVRAVYMILEDDGTDCMVPGYTIETP